MTDELETGEPQLPDALLRALRAPGSAEELSDEPAVMAAFRAAHAAGRAAGPAGAPRLRLVGRLGVGGVAAAATLVLGSGVAAAAYTSNLPEPVQQLAHRVLSPIGVPDAAPRHHRPTPSLTAPPPTSTSGAPTSHPSHSSSPKPTRRPSTIPTRAASSPSGASPSAITIPPPTSSATSPTTSPTSPATSSATPSVSASPSATSSPTASGSPTTQPSKPPRAVPASVTLTLSATHVTAGSTVRVTGSVADAAGKPVSRQRVTLQASTGTGWRAVSSAISDRAGSVSLYSPAITQNTRYRLKVTSPALARPLLSSVVRVTETPELVVTYADGAIQISAVGAQDGDQVKVDLVGIGSITQVGTVTLAASGGTFPLEHQATKRRFVVILARTPQHLGAKASLVVPRSA